VALILIFTISLRVCNAILIFTISFGFAFKIGCDSACMREIGKDPSNVSIIMNIFQKNIFLADLLENCFLSRLKTHFDIKILCNLEYFF
jgi:hypothetical protein